MTTGQRVRPDVAARLLERARRANTAGKPVEAGHLVARGLAAMGIAGADVGGPRSAADAALVSRLLVTGAWPAAELSGLTAGLAMLASAEHVLDVASSREERAVIVSQRCLMRQRFGDVDAALADYATIEAVLPDLAPFDRCTALINRGVLYLARLDLTRAAADFETCAGIARPLGLTMFYGMAEHNRGYAEFLRGNIPVALRAMADAVAISDELPIGVSALDRARVLTEAGLIREADAALAQAAAVFTHNRMAQDLGETLVERARCALLTGDVAATRRLAGRARDIFRRRGNDRWRRTAELTLLHGDLAAGRPGGRLVAPALRLRAEFDDGGLRLEAHTAALVAAEAGLRARRVADVGGLLAEQRQPRSTDPITVRLHDRRVRALHDLAVGDAASAARRARLGLDELAAYQARFGSIDLQTAAAVHGRGLAELDLSIALASGRPGVVLAAAERGRAASNRLTLVRPPADERVAQLLAELRHVAESLHAAGSDRARAAELHDQRRLLEREITATGWARTGSGAAGRPVGLGAVRDALATDEVLVNFVVARGQLHALVIGSEQQVIGLGPLDRVVELVRRVRADLDVLAQAYLPAALRETVAAAAQRSVAALDDELVHPLGVGGRRVVLVTTGALGHVPWNLLPSLRATPVVVAPSATSWVAASASQPGRPRRVVAVSGPDVPYASREVAEIGAVWATSAVTVDADRATLASGLSDATLLHVAAHGVHNTENALFSSVRMADGLLFAHELDAHERTPEHVVLSACEVGLATVRPGDEALGLTSVLLRLGTRSVVAGVARVADELAADAMVDYHRRLAAGADSATALAEATAKADGLVPFVCFGSGWRAT